MTKGRKKRAYEKPVVPTVIPPVMDAFDFRPFEPLPDKKVACPKCGKIGEPSGRRNVEGSMILRCKTCGIEYSEHKKKGFCSWVKNPKFGSWLKRLDTKERVFVRSIVPSECRTCINNKGPAVQCPYFQGVLGKQLEFPEQWEKV